MKNTFLMTGLAIILATTPAFARMMGGQHMYQQQQERETQQQQYNPYQMYPGMMGGYSYGMPNMMGGYGYGMAHQTMGGYGMYGACGRWQGPYFNSQEDYIKFLDDTKETR